MDGTDTGLPRLGIDHVQHATTVSLDFDFPDAGYFPQGTQRHRPVPGNRAQSLVVKMTNRATPPPRPVLSATGATVRRGADRRMGSTPSPANSPGVPTADSSKPTSSVQPGSRPRERMPSNTSCPRVVTSSVG